MGSTPVYVLCKSQTIVVCIKPTYLLSLLIVVVTFAIFAMYGFVALKVCSRCWNSSICEV